MERSLSTMVSQAAPRASSSATAAPTSAAVLPRRGLATTATTEGRASMT